MNRELAGAAIRGSHMVMNKDLGRVAPSVIHDEHSSNDVDSPSAHDSDEEVGDPRREEHSSEEEHETQANSIVQDEERHDADEEVEDAHI
jgi:hypothetical protein